MMYNRIKSNAVKLCFLALSLLVLSLSVSVRAQSESGFSDPVADQWVNTYQPASRAFIQSRTAPNVSGIDPQIFTHTSPQDPMSLNAEQPVIPGPMFLAPRTPEPLPKPSALERMYSKRVAEDLRQFGYDLFGIPERETHDRLSRLSADKPLKPMGAVQKNFILNIGDELEIVFKGQRTDRDSYEINDQGLILIENMPPIPAAGRTIGQVRLSIEAAARHMYNTEAFVSLANVRQINVLVVGHVNRPGRQNATVFHTVLDALMSAGGIAREGSLRQIRLVREGKTQKIDLYDLLLSGSPTADLRLRDGDRLIIPAIGPTIAVSGEVKRPGIFEIPPGKKLSIEDMLTLSGGVLAPGKNRFLKLEITTEGREQTKDITGQTKRIFGDGSIMMIAKGKETRVGTVELRGHTTRPGLHALRENDSLRKLFDSADMLERDIYALAGVIKRWDKSLMAYKYFAFPLRAVLEEEFDRKLKDADTIHLFSQQQIRQLQQTNEDVGPTATKQLASLSNGVMPDIQDSTQKPIDPVIAAFLRERFAFVRGAVRHPGAYPVAEGTTLDAILAVAGGLTLEANTSNIEITTANAGQGHQREGRSGTRRIQVNFRETSPRDVLISAGDAVRVNQKFKKIEDQSVLITGEVRHPGRYDLLAGDKLSDLLRRAGGLTTEAYPEGAIFSRDSERRAEEKRFQAKARELKRAVAAALESDSKDINPGNVSEARALAEELENAEGIGRITVEADPAALKAMPELDILLQHDDRIYIPKRTLSVRVSGEVLSPASLQFREDKDPLDYIREAGGFAFHADKDRSFVLYPNGSAEPLSVNVWNHTAVKIPPGASIIVPRDPKPFDFVDSAKDISQILSNLAVTAIFIDDVRDDD